MVSPQRCFGQFQTQDTLEIFRFMQETPAYSYTGRAENKGFNKMCDVPWRAESRLPPWPHSFQMRPLGREAFKCLGSVWHVRSVFWKPGLNDAFPQSCVASGWGAKNKVGAGTVPNGKATLAIYALQTTLSQGERIEVN